MSTVVLLPNEENIMSSPDGALMLTNFRVKHESSKGGTSAYKSIPLGKVSCCALTTKNYPILLILAALAGIGIFASPTEQGRILAAVIAFVLGLTYFFTQNGQIEIVSDSGSSISVPTKGLKHEDVLRFVEAVALALLTAR